MPLFLERNDLSRMEVDAVVLPANPWLEEGPGTSRVLFKAAGETKLEEACQKLGYVDYGKAVMTAGFNLPARYIIHAVVPLYMNNDDRDETELLRSCYTESLSLAARNGLTSIAFPLLSSGSFRWPKADALRIASEAVIEFLSRVKTESGGRDLLSDMATDPGDMDVYLVLYDGESLHAAEGLYGDIKKYIDDSYVEEQLDELPDMSEFFTQDIQPAASMPSMPEPDAAPDTEPDTEPDMQNRVAERRTFRWSTFFGRNEIKEAPEVEEAAPVEALVQADPAPDSLDDILETEVETFNDILLGFVNESGLSNPEIYSRANMSKQQFSKIMSNKVVPKKSSILALAIALSLNLEETEKLLMKAGYALSDSSVFDLGVSYFISHEIYDIFAVNMWLYDNKLPLLGSSSL